MVIGQKPTVGSQSDSKPVALLGQRETLTRADETLQAAEVGDGLNDKPF